MYCAGPIARLVGGASQIGQVARWPMLLALTDAGRTTNCNVWTGKDTLHVCTWCTPPHTLTHAHAHITYTNTLIHVHVMYSQIMRDGTISHVYTHIPNSHKLTHRPALVLVVSVECGTVQNPRQPLHDSSRGGSRCGCHQ